MMQLGKAFYCDSCGCEIISDDCCMSCDPENGSSPITFSFVAFVPVTIEPSSAQPSSQQEDRSWWKNLFWS